MTMNGPLVSILIPCYNAQDWVANAIESALGQTYPNIEIIVLDDGSSDGSIDVIKGFEGRITWETGPNRGAQAARNILLEMCRGEWIQFLDADDFLMPRKIEAQLELGIKEQADLVVAPSLNDKGIVSQEPKSDDPWVNLILVEFGNTVANFFKKSAVQRAGGWNPEQPCCQEYELMFRMLMGGARVAYCRRTLAIYYTVNPDSIYRQDASRGPRMHGRIIEKVVNYLVEIGEFTDARKHAATMKSFALAQKLWELRSPYASELEALALRLDPEFPRQAQSMWPVYGLLYRAFGFYIAQTYAKIRRAARNVCAAVWPLGRKKATDAWR